MRPMPKAITLTDRAADRIRTLMSKTDQPILGLKIGVKTRGCSGLTYTMEYAGEKGKFDDVVEDKGVTVLIDPSATMFLLGTQMDYVDDGMGAKFVFKNPNEIDRCGCGESFRVAQKEEEAAANS